MYGLMTNQKLNGRARAPRALSAVAFAALVLLATTPAPAFAQGGASEPTFRGGVVVASGAAAAGPQVGSTVTFTYVVRNTGSVGLMPWQTLRIAVPVSVALGDSSVRPVKNTVRIYDPAGNLLSQTDQVESPHEVGHLLGIGHVNVSGGDINDLFIFRAPGDRAQVLIDVESSFAAPRGQEQEPGARLYAPTFELINDASGETTAWGALTKAGAGTLVLAGGNTF